MDIIGCDFSFAFIYLDVILVASSSHEEHHQHLKQLLDTSTEFGLIINSDKCVLGIDNFLGYKVPAVELIPLHEKVSAVQAFLQPQTVDELMCFNGMVSFYNHFILHVSLVMAPM